jgi:hypothetical protein
MAGLNKMDAPDVPRREKVYHHAARDTEETKEDPENPLHPPSQAQSPSVQAGSTKSDADLDKEPDSWYDESFEEHILKMGASYNEDDHTRKKKFLFRLVLALHASGNMSYKTEQYIRMVANVYQVHCTCLLLPVTAVFTFHTSATNLSSYTSETYNLRWDANCR